MVWLPEEYDAKQDRIDELEKQRDVLAHALMGLLHRRPRGVPQCWCDAPAFNMTTHTEACLAARQALTDAGVEL